MKNREENYKEQMKILDEYKINQKLKTFDILHIYPKEEAFPNGFYDSKFFDLHIYNTKNMEKRIIEHKDGLLFSNDVDIDIIRVYIDNSFFIRFKKIEDIRIFQCCYIGDVKS